MSFLHKVYLYGKALFAAAVPLVLSGYQILSDQNVSLDEARAFWTLVAAAVAGVGTAVVGPRVERT